MVGCMVYVLVTFLSLDLADALMCFSCYEQTESRYCREQSACPPELKICKTTVYSPHVGYPFTGEELVTRSCAKSCEETHPDIIGHERPMFCCTTDFCNNRGLFETPDHGTNSSGAATRSCGVMTISLGIVGILLQN